MSAPDPKLWEATEDQIESVHYHREMYRDGWECEARKTFEFVARRRALAELKALLPSCNAAQIHARIKAIEAEASALSVSAPA